jgi:hypothetical protein
MLTGLAAFVWLWSDLNAMRLYTIAQAPSYVPMGVIDYWVASGVVIGALLVLVAETMVYTWRLSNKRRELLRAPTSEPTPHPLPPPPPGYRA